MDNDYLIIAVTLCRLLTRNNEGEKLLQGKSKLTLPTRILNKLNTVFYKLDDKLNSFRNSITNYEYQCIMYLRQVFNKITKLKLTSLKHPCSSEVDITRFTQLKSLELEKVELRFVKGLQYLRPQLEILSYVSSHENNLDGLTAEYCGEIWSELTILHINFNNIETISNNSFALTPNIKYLNLSSNNISSLDDALESLNHLKYLNLAFNQLDTLPFLSSESYNNLEELIICNNLIESITGIWLFKNLNVLDLSYNLIDNHSNIKSLCELNRLQNLNFIGNPISFHVNHRTYTCVCLNRNITSKSFVLDNRTLSSNEIKLIGSRNDRSMYTSQYSSTGRRGEIISKQYQRLPSISSSISVDTVVYAKDMKSNNSSQILSNLDYSIPTGSGMSSDDKSLLDSSLSKSVTLSSGRKPRKVREAVIVDVDPTKIENTPLPLILPPVNDDHLKIKKEVEQLRKRYGENHWLHSYSGSFVQDLLGLQKTPRSSAILSEALVAKIIEEENNQEKSDSESNKISSDKSSLPKESPSDNRIKSDSTLDNYSYDSNIKKLSDNDSSFLDISNQSKDGDSSLELISQETQYLTASEDISNDEDLDELSEEEESAIVSLVQKVLPGKLEEVFFVVREKEILEKDPINNRTLVRWGLSTLESCTKISAQPPTIQLKFDTIRKNCDKRTYVMQPEDSQDLLKRLDTYLESKPLKAMNQYMYKCMQCSTIFSREIKNTIINLVQRSNINCDICKSNLVIRINEDDHEQEHLPSSLKTSAFNSSANSSNYDNYNSNYKSDAVKQTKRSTSPSQCSIGSAASLDQSSSRESPAVGLGDNNNTNNTNQSVKCDSDIEIISNPSQSSIEVLEVHARLSSLSSNRNYLNEQHQISTAPNLTTLTEITNNNQGVNNILNNPTQLTESSSSGSLTDSVCTAYENHPKNNKTLLISQISAGGDSLVGRDNDNNSNIISTESTDNFNLQPPQSTGRDYDSILQDLLNSVNSNLGTSDNMVPSNNQNSLDDHVRYNYSDFSDVDHRIKLYIYEKLFKFDDEELVLLLKANVMDKLNSFYPGCLVISTYSCFLLKVFGEESGDDAENFLEKVFGIPLSTLKVKRLSWDQCILVNSDNNQYLLILHDSIRTDNLFKYISKSSINNEEFTCIAEDNSEVISSLPFINSDSYMALQNVLSSNKNIQDSNNICTLSITCSTTVKRDNEDAVVLPFATIANTNSDIFLLNNDLRWIYKENSIPTIYAVNNIINLINVSVQNCQLLLHFLEETEAVEETWTIIFETPSPINSIIESVKTPWEKIFSVPLHVSPLS